MLMIIANSLGVPFWLLLGWLASALWRQHELKQLPGVFKAKLRMVSGTHKHVDSKFPHTAEHALWQHDVLILQKGLLLTRMLLFPVADGVQPPQTTDNRQIKGLGEALVTMQFRLDDGEVIEIAVPAALSAQAQGPFFSNITQ